MTKFVVRSLFTLVLAVGVYSASQAQSKTTDFSGKWALDKSLTSDLPQTLESYTLTVTQDAQHLTYETDLQGEIGMRGRRGGGRRGGEGSPSNRQEGGQEGGQGGGSPRGPGGGRRERSGGDGGFSLPKDAIMGMALRMTPAKATYTLDGKETAQQLEDSGNDQRRRRGGSLAFKANWKKGGKILELQSIRKFETPEGERTMTSKDLWELSENGDTLTINREIDMPMGMQEVKFVFTKQ
jgi:hypothetical protein